MRYNYENMNVYVEGLKYEFSITKLWHWIKKVQRVQQVEARPTAGSAH